MTIDPVIENFVQLLTRIYEFIMYQFAYSNIGQNMLGFIIVIFTIGVIVYIIKKCLT